MFAQMTLSLAVLFAAVQGEQTTESARSARDWIERAAFAEEHERAFEQAAELFATAVEVARASGDAAAETEANAGLARLRYRQGQEQGPEDVPEPIQRRIEALLLELAAFDNQSDDNSYESQLRDLALFGARAVPYLEQGLTSTMTTGRGRFDFSTLVAARGLARIDAPEALAALERSLSSEDPFIRRDVAVAMSPSRHAGLLVRAARDPIDKVRNAAYRSLRYSANPDAHSDLTEVMMAGAREGNGYASDWMADWRSAELVRLVSDEEIPAETRVGFVQALERRSSDAFTADLAVRIVELARTEPTTSLELSKVLRNFVRGGRRSFGGTGELPAVSASRIETAILEGLEVFLVDNRGVQNYLETLATVGGPRSIETLVAKVANDQAPEESLTAIGRALSDLVGHSRAEDFEVMARTYRSAPEPGGEREPSRFIFNALQSGLMRLAEGITEAQLRAGYEGLEGEHRSGYHWVAKSWLEKVRFDMVESESEQLLLDMLKNPASDDVRWTGAVALRHRASAPSARALFEAYASSAGQMKRAARDSLGSLATNHPSLMEPLMIESLEKSMSDGGSARGAELISWLPDDSGLRVFDALWPKASEALQKQHLYIALLTIGGAEANKRLIASYGEVSSNYRRQAIDRFGKQLVQDAMPLLGEALEDSSPVVRDAARAAFLAFKAHREALEEYAAWTAQDREARASIQELLDLLASDNRDVVLGAIDALAALKAKNALAPLVRLLEGDDEEIKTATREAIRRIGE